MDGGFYQNIYNMVEKTSDQKMTYEKMINGYINSIHDGYVTDKAHQKPHIELTDNQLKLLEKIRIYNVQNIRFKYHEQQKYGLYNILSTITQTLKYKVEHPMS